VDRRRRQAGEEGEEENEEDEEMWREAALAAHREELQKAAQLQGWRETEGWWTSPQHRHRQRLAAQHPCPQVHAGLRPHIRWQGGQHNPIVSLDLAL
jgi:hypothetical protein